MLKITKRSDDRVDIELSGKIDAIEMAAALDSLIEQSKDVHNGQMLYEISDFSLPTLGAIGVEVARLPSLFRLLSKFDRCALLSDSNWLRKASEVEGALLPGLEIKSFEMHERDAAEVWLTASK
ncbi:SpoIIAA-like protein [Yoonia maritima]|uniref:SpoIIAA-like protein n=1 Tax=Yoonia maritima TaxID=1435347 RepID=A0A2T0W541_9RHOB|nr:STAS/SEC14 domain-containing protein [Yoonia maritima]PRY80547.1 SpoIIAA-like protein [Yoonia maritima]